MRILHLLLRYWLTATVTSTILFLVVLLQNEKSGCPSVSKYSSDRLFRGRQLRIERVSRGIRSQNIPRQWCIKYIGLEYLPIGSPLWLGFDTVPKGTHVLPKGSYPVDTCPTGGYERLHAN